MRPRIPSLAVEGLLYALTAFGPFAFGGVEPWSRSALQVLAFLLALACFLRGRPAASRAGRWFWLFPAGVAVLGLAQLLNSASPSGPRPLAPFTVAPYETRAAVMLWAAHAAVLWSVPRVIIAPDAARRYVRVLVGIGVALACLGLLQAASGGDRLYWLRAAPRTSFFGSYYNRDHAANVLLMSLAVGIGAAFSRPRSALAAGLVVVFIGLAVCSSQAAFLAVPLSASCVAFLAAGFARSARRRRWRAAAAIGAAALTVFLAYRHVAAGVDAGGLVERSVMARLSIYADAARWWLDAPLFGTGLGGFETTYPSYQDWGLAGAAAHAHSDWIEFALETGLLGLVWAFLAAAAAARCVAKTWREARSSEMRALIGGALAAAAAFAAHSLFEFNFQIPANAIMFFGVLGLALSAPSWADKTAARVPARVPSAGLSLLAAACCLVLCGSAVLPAAAARRASVPGAPAERLVTLSRALRLDDSTELLVRASLTAAVAAAEGEPADRPLLRIALRYGLAALERRPFDAEALHLTGELLRLLGRRGDSRDLLERADLVRFARVEPRSVSSAERRRRKLEDLRALFDVSRGPEER